MLQIDRMQNSDLDAVVELEQTFFSSPWSKKAFHEAIDNKDAIYLVAKEEQIVVGYIGAYCIVDEADINQIAVHKNYQHMGIGTALLENLVKFSKEHNVNSITLEVRASNQNAILLYQKSGFVTEGIRRNFYDLPKEDALIMWKR